MKLKAKVTFEWEYRITPESYGTDDPAQAAKNEIKWLEDGTGNLYEFLEFCCPNEPEIEIKSAEEEQGLSKLPSAISRGF